MWSVPRLGALAGSAGGLAMVLAGLALQPLVGLPTLPELLQDRLLKLTPGALFGLLIDRLQYAGRPLLYSGLLLLELVVLAAVGAIAVTVTAWHGSTSLPLRRGRQLGRILALALLLWLLIGLLVLPLAGLGPFAHDSRFASGTLIWGYLLEALLFSSMTWLFVAGLNRPSERSIHLRRNDADARRRAVAVGVGLAALATLGATAFRRYQGELPAGTPATTAPLDASPLLGTGKAPVAAAGEVTKATEATTALTIASDSGSTPAMASGIAAVTTSSAPASTLLTATPTPGTAEAAAATIAPTAPLLTPTDAFYVVSKNLDDPAVKAETWQLSVKGQVRTPLTLNLGALMALPFVEQYRTLACISNDVGGSLMSNAHWRGVPLFALLDRAGADPGASFVLFTSTDDYTESVPMAIARQPTTLVAYQMNGATLPVKHGFPARIVLAGRYGMKNPKWLTEIKVAKDDSPGFWEQQGWDQQAVVRTTSRIDGPKDGAALNQGSIAISGVAYAGDRGIQGVQVQIEPGTSWQTAILQPVAAASTWTAWRYTWTPPHAGNFRITVRATDGSGAPQEAQPQDSFPLGAAGLHTITVQTR